MNKLPWLVLLVLNLVSCTTPEKETLAVRQVVEDIIAADNRADLNKVFSFYDSDAVLIPPGKPEIKGLPSIRENYKNIFDGSVLQLRVQIEEVTIAGDIAICKGKTLGKLINKTDSTISEVNDKFVMTLKKTERWRITLLIWNR